MRAISLLALGLALAGCATVTRGTTDVFEVTSAPAGATVSTSNGYACVTPCALKMPRRSEFDVSLSKPGYKPAKAHVTNRVSGQGGAAMAGNLIAGGIIGAGVDAGSGAMLDLVPNPLHVPLEPVGGDVLSRSAAGGLNARHISF